MRPPKWSLRPLEWVALGFVVLVVSLAGSRSFILWNDMLGVRGRRLLIALISVGVLRLARTFRAVPWPDGSGELSKRFWIAGVVALIPCLAVWLDNPILAELLQPPDDRLDHALGRLLTLTVQVAGVSSVSLGIWLGVGMHLKRHRGFVVRSFLSESAIGLGANAREWLPILVLISGYAWMGLVMDLKPQIDRDNWMIAADRFLFFGVDPTDALEQIINRPLSVWLAFSYSFYAVLYPLCLGGVYLKAGRLALREAMFAVGTALALAYLCYWLVPVKGPLLSRTFAVSLDLYLIQEVKETLMDRTRIAWDCFPSMHTCAALLLSLASYKHLRGLFWVTLPMVVSIPFACVYLRYHYVVDVLAGFALAGAMVVLSRAVFGRNASGDAAAGRGGPAPVR
jgi:hypothetical protein